MEPPGDGAEPPSALTVAVTAVLLALLTAVVWGFANYLGPLLSRTRPLGAVLVERLGSPGGPDVEGAVRVAVEALAAEGLVAIADAPSCA